MKLDQIKELITLMRKNKIKEINLEQEGEKIRIVSNDIVPPRQSPEMVALPHMSAPSYMMMSPEKSMVSAPPAALPETKEPEGTEIKSPMVGTFYRAPAPDAPPYVEEGAEVNSDTVLCIIEAMKLMNEIKAETRGKIVRALVENGQPVEFGQPLFLVEPF
ncbi:acetyl-CoA carboxylase biotin carboxyl carrier protein [bacterium]|nr:acetyl-CoA carboxylase biotin carboxyl carrier protein [bacterium]